MGVPRGDLTSANRPHVREPPGANSANTPIRKFGTAVLLVGGVDTQCLIQATEAGRRVESESESADDGEQPSLPFPRLERADGDES